MRVLLELGQQESARFFKLDIVLFPAGTTRLRPARKVHIQTLGSAGDLGVPDVGINLVCGGDVGVAQDALGLHLPYPGSIHGAGHFVPELMGRDGGVIHMADDLFATQGALDLLHRDQAERTAIGLLLMVVGAVCELLFAADNIIVRPALALLQQRQKRRQDGYIPHTVFRFCGRGVRLVVHPSGAFGNVD